MTATRGLTYSARMMRAWMPLACLALSGCYAPTDQPTVDTDSASDGSTSMTSGPTTTAPTTTVTTTDDTTVTATDPSTETTDPTTDPDSSSSTGEVLPFECVEAVLDPNLGSNLVQIATRPAGDDFSGSCGGGGSPDAAYEWRVPYDGFFVLDTEGSDFDTVIFALDSACDGAEIACNDNAPDVGYSQIIAPFTQDQRVVVVLDGSGGESGTAQLNISAVDCPSADVSGQDLPQDFSNVAGSNDHDGTCGGAGNPERAFRWTAPAAGLYSVVATSSDFVPAVYVEQGPVCGGPELGCNADPGSERGEVVRELAEGDIITIIVDSTGGTGDFTLDVLPVDAMCPGVVLDGGMPFADNIDNYADHMTSSCGADGYVEGGNYNPYADATFAFTSPGKIGASSGCDITVTSGFPAAISLQEGNCDGPEVQCVPSVFDALNMNYQGVASIGHIPVTDFTLTVSPTQPEFSGWVTHDFVIEIFCFAIA